MTKQLFILFKIGLILTLFPHPDPINTLGAGNSKENTITILSANIRVALKTDDEKGTGWNDRKDLVFKVVKAQKANVICLQEVLEVQNDDFKKAFPKFTSFGFEGPEMDAFTDGEYHLIAKNPILFNHQKFEFIGGGTYWLSETPHIGGSMSWETSRARHVNWVRLKNKNTGKVVRVLNAHLDHKSEGAKLKQVAMILEETQQYRADFCQILAGDFNSDSSQQPIQTILKSWKDSYQEIHNRGDPCFTVHGFIGPKATTKKGKVDFIFYQGPITPISSKIIKDNEKGIYPSDHYFVSSTLSLN